MSYDIIRCLTIRLKTRIRRFFLLKKTKIIILDFASLNYTFQWVLSTRDVPRPILSVSMNVSFDYSHPVERFLRGKLQLAETEGLISSIFNTECDHFWARDRTVTLGLVSGSVHPYFRPESVDFRLENSRNLMAAIEWSYSYFYKFFLFFRMYVNHLSEC